VRAKWYVEFPILLVLIGAAILFALNVNIHPAGNTPVTGNQIDTFKVSKKSSPEKEKWEAGKSLFKSNCAACHNPKSDGTGPALLGVTQRWNAAGSYKGKTGKQWLYAWIHNWNDVVDAGYKYGLDMKNSRPAEMNVFGSVLSDDDIDKILLYVENPDANRPGTVATK
jgi:mono/diheme cytochrome c family protein